MPITLQQLEAETVQKLENRTTNTANIDRYLRDALIELTGNPDLRDSFPDLEVRGPLFNLTGGPVGVSVQEYPEQNLIVATDYNIKTLDILIWIDFPNNTRYQKLNPSHYQETDTYLQGPSRPVDWYRFNNNIGFYPTPDRNYQVQTNYQRRHPIVDYFNQSNLLNTTVILMPNEWFEILEWAAAMRGYAELLNFQRASEIDQLLWGRPDPNNAAERLPGLITNVKSKRRSEAWMQTQPLRPILKSYTWGS